MSDHVLRSGELLATDITGVLVVILGAGISSSHLKLNRSVYCILNGFGEIFC